MVQRESRPSKIGPINLDTKQTGAPSAANPHAGCDVAGAGNGFTVLLLRHSQRKRGGTARLNLRNTAPVLDPTRCPPHSSQSPHPVNQATHHPRAPSPAPSSFADNYLRFRHNENIPQTTRLLPRSEEH